MVRSAQQSTNPELVLQEEVRRYEIALEDLRIHKIELEMQNDELRRIGFELEIARARYFELYDLAPVGYCTINAVDLVLETNLTVSTLLGQTRLAMQKKPFHRFIHPDQQPAYTQAHRQLFETGETLSLDVQLLKKSGVHFWAHLEATIRPDSPENSEKDTDRPIAAWIVISDISERKRTEEALRESEAKFRTIFEQAAVGVAVLETQTGKYERINQVYCDFIGYTPEEMTQMGFQNVTYPDDTQANIDHNAQLIAGQIHSFALEKRYVRRDGSVVWGKLTASPLWKPGDTPHTYFHIAVVEDITERKRMEQELLLSELDLAEAQSIAHIGSWKWDVNNREVTWSDEMFRIFGIDKNSYTGRLGDAARNAMHPDDLYIVMPDNAANIANVPFEYRIIRTDGAIRLIWAKAANTIFDQDGKPTLLFGVAQDITERKQAEQALLEVHKQMESIIESTRAGTWIWNIQTGETIFNETWAQIIGYSLDELVPTTIKTWEMLTHPDDVKQSNELLERHFEDKLSNYDCELRMKHKDGHWVWIHDYGRVFTRTDDGKPLLMFGTHTDITESKLAEEKKQLLTAELEKLSVTDTLTQLSNRRYFMQRVLEEINRESRNNQPLCLLMLDLDEFKKINDTYGHAIGDLVLQQVAKVLRSNVREIDILGRIGGEEFAVLLPNTLLQDAVILAERMRQSIENAPIDISIQPVRITISIGAAEYHDEMSSMSDLLRNADQAMYLAKYSGRNCVRIFPDNLPRTEGAKPSRFEVGT